MWCLANLCRAIFLVGCIVSIRNRLISFPPPVKMSHYPNSPSLPLHFLTACGTQCQLGWIGSSLCCVYSITPAMILCVKQVLSKKCFELSSGGSDLIRPDEMGFMACLPRLHMVPAVWLSVETSCFAHIYCHALRANCKL